jgi:ribosomal protein L40E
MRKVWVESTSDRAVWRCAGCATINDWSATVCGYCSKSYNGEEKMWEYSYCYTVNSWSAAKCGHCDKKYKG